MGRTLRAVIAFVILVVLHYTLRPVLAWRAAPDFLMLALLLASVRLRPGTAAVLGLAMGLVADSVSLGALGGAALAMSVIAFAASWLKSVFFADDLILNGFFFFVGKYSFDLLYFAFQNQMGGAELAIQLFTWSLLSAAVTAIVGLIVLVLLRPMLETAPA
jgi:rod shape-determining protein MreD